jgi:hypothetical protein
VHKQTDDDLIGALERKGTELAVNTDQPAAYTYLSHTRFNGQVLPQVNYVFWFPARTTQSNFDIYAGPFDSIVWRVTLDGQGNALWFDSIHSCGCYHKIYVPEERWQLDPDMRGEKPVLVNVSSALKTEQPMLWISAGEHYILSVTAADDITGAVPYEFEPYEKILFLTDDEQKVSTFNERGLMTESKRLERFLLWPQGIESAGAMRMRGTQATAFVGTRHFDDAFLFENLLTKNEAY